VSGCDLKVSISSRTHTGRVGDNNCVLCARNESIDHLFFACPIARMIWSVFQYAYNTPAQPSRMAELGSWLENFSGQESVSGLKLVWLLCFGSSGKRETEHVLIMCYHPILVTLSIRFVICLTVGVNCRNQEYMRSCGKEVTW
jgi:hypothetical protein